jgi:hypothetical protein
LFQEKQLIRAKFDLNQQVFFCVVTTAKFKKSGYITAAEASQLLDGVDQQIEKEMSGSSAGSLVEWFNTRIASVAKHSKQEVSEGTFFEAEVGDLSQVELHQAEPKRDMSCFAWMNQGSCKFSDKCRYTHEKEKQGGVTKICISNKGCCNEYRSEISNSEKMHKSVIIDSICVAETRASLEAHSELRAEPMAKRAKVREESTPKASEQRPLQEDFEESLTNITNTESKLPVIVTDSETLEKKILL